MKAYREGLLLGGEPAQTSLEIALDYIDTVEANISSFLENKSDAMVVNLEKSEQDFRLFWERIGARGDLRAALDEWQTPHNASLI